MIVLLESVHPEAHDWLAEVEEVRLMVEPSRLDPELDTDRVRAVVTRGRGRITEELLAGLPQLEVVARCGAGLDNVDTDAAAAAGVPVVYAPGATTAAVAEHALMLMLALARRLVHLDRAVHRGRWSERDGYLGTELRGKRLGIVGLGAIGRRLAELGRALEMDVVYWSRSSTEDSLPRLSLYELLATSDLVQLCVALTPETTGLMGAEQLAAMRADALLVNTARGALVDHEALRQALDDGVIAGYGTDVWDIEPPPENGRLWAHERVLVTPHTAGLTDVTYREICVRACAAVAAVLSGVEPDPASVFSRPTG